jgi:hypothetical protein
MDGFSTREAAKQLGIKPMALSRYIALGRVPAPAVVTLGRSKVHIWTKSQIDHVRSLLPTIANGRKTRHKKKQSAGTPQQLAKRKGAQARAPMLQKKNKLEK